MDTLYRPLCQTGPARPDGALTLAGGWTWFTHVECLRRGRPGRILPAREIPPEVLDRLTAPRPAFAGLTLDRPRIMGILNVTPDSFSDGGLFDASDRALDQARAMARDAEILDIGGESTRPGAATVPEDQEIARTAPVIAALRAEGIATPISIDTRKAAVARAALAAGATIVNDVSALTYDPALAGTVAASEAPVVLMHAQGTPETMQIAPAYDDVLHDVCAGLAARVAAAEAAGIPRDRIAIDPGIGFGKTQDHNLALLARLSVFHALGLPILLGASRKRFIGTIGGAEAPRDRAPGSVAVALHAIAQGVQMLRVHDTSETRQAFSLWRAVTEGQHA